MKVAPILYSVNNNYKICKRNSNKIVAANVAFMSKGHNTAKVGAGIFGAVIGAIAGFCTAGPLGAFIGATALGSLTSSAQQSENDDMDRGDNTSMFEGRDESARL